MERSRRAGADVGAQRCWIGGRCAAATPCCSSACAMRKATSSRHGAQMICTPIGKGDSGTGATTTGRPIKEIGCV